MTATANANPRLPSAAMRAPVRAALSDRLDALADACKPLMGDPIAVEGLKRIAEKFNAEAGFGPVTVRQFLTDSVALGGMSPDQVQVDAFRQVRGLLDRLGF